MPCINTFLVVGWPVLESTCRLLKHVDTDTHTFVVKLLIGDQGRQLSRRVLPLYLQSIFAGLTIYISLYPLLNHLHPLNPGPILKPLHFFKKSNSLPQIIVFTLYVRELDFGQIGFITHGLIPLMLDQLLTQHIVNRRRLVPKLITGELVLKRIVILNPLPTLFAPNIQTLIVRLNFII